MSTSGFSQRVIESAITRLGARPDGVDRTENGSLILHFDANGFKFSTFCFASGTPGLYALVVLIAAFEARAGTISLDRVNTLNRGAHVTRYVKRGEARMAGECGYCAVGGDPAHLGQTVLYWLNEVSHDLSD